MYKPINDYGIIGDMNSAALVGMDGSIDWCCLPRFDSASVFAAILDDQNGGCFRIAPTSSTMTTRQAYLPNTNIVSTHYRTPTGEVSLTDFMPVSSGGSLIAPHEIHRIVKCVRGTVEIGCNFRPRLDFARPGTTLIRLRGGVIARGRRQVVSLCSQVPLEINGSDATAQFTVHQGQEVVFVLAYGSGRPQNVASYHTFHKFVLTQQYWENIASEINYDGMWKDEVVRSFLTLRLLTYAPTGAIVAAPITSLPEGIGGSRNWDYRYSWLRDSSFTMDILYRLGHTGEAARYLRWLVHQCKVTNGKTRIVYGISPVSSLKEKVLDHLEGYRGSGPVRIGNGAAGHFQLDVFGEVILSIETLLNNGGGISDDAWSVVDNFAEVVCKNWHRKDRGVWEVRGAPQHFVYSKVMCWVALDRAIRLAKILEREERLGCWEQIANEIRDDILQHGWSEGKQAFVQSYSSDAIDASNLMIPFVGFLPPDDPRVASTMDVIARELADGPLVRRYLPEGTDDGLAGEKEGPFVILSFWLIGNLIYTGQIERAREYFEQVLSYANHLGLLSEMVDPTTRELLGNFPQAYSHIGLIHTALNLSRALNSNQPRDARESVELLGKAA